MKAGKAKNFIVCGLLSLVLLGGFPLNTFAGKVDDYGINQIQKEVQDTGSYLVKAIGEPTYAMVGGDWTVLALARSSTGLPKGFAESYFNNTEKVLKEKTGQLTRNKYSEYSRLILSLAAIGKNPTNVGGYNMLERLSDLTLVEKQGINGPIYALLALDSLDYSIPKSSVALLQTTKELLISYILERELPGGGFSLGGITADPDVTAAALQALSRYKDREDVKASINLGLNYLSKVQTGTGGFNGWSTGGLENAESVAQVVLALTSLGIDPATDERFLKTDSSGVKYSPLDALGVFRLKDGSYRHVLKGEADLMATEQAMLALVAYERMLQGKTAIFDMKDVAGGAGGQGGSHLYKVILNGNYLTFDQPPINRNGRILVPMRAIFEALEADIAWNGEIKRVVGVRGNIRVQLDIGADKAFINGSPVSLDVAATIENGRTLVPVRVISEGLNAKVGWDSNSNTVTITTN